MWLLFLVSFGCVNNHNLSIIRDSIETSPILSKNMQLLPIRGTFFKRQIQETDTRDRYKYCLLRGEEEEFFLSLSLSKHSKAVAQAFSAWQINLFLD